MAELEGYLRKGTSKAASFWKDFTAFAFKGNMVQLAIAVVIGQAFGKVVDSLVKNVIMPLISYISGPSSSHPGGYQPWKIGRVEAGVFIGDLLQFLIVALAVYVVIVKFLGTIQRVVPFLGPDEPMTKECPFCLSKIAFKATKCAHCTADLPAATGEAATAL